MTLTDFCTPTHDKKTLEGEGLFTPNFDQHGLITAVAIDNESGDILMLAHMNAQALALTLESGIVHYYSRSRKTIWKKGETSGNVQHLIEMRTDCDQDAVIMRVSMAGDGQACHTGRRSCFYRKVIVSNDTAHLEIG